MIFVKEKLIVNKNDWLFNYKNRITAVVPIEKESDEVYVIAYSDDFSEGTKIRQIAKENNGYILKNAINKEMTLGI